MKKTEGSCEETSSGTRDSEAAELSCEAAVLFNIIALERSWSSFLLMSRKVCATLDWIRSFFNFKKTISMIWLMFGNSVKTRISFGYRNIMRWVSCSEILIRCVSRLRGREPVTISRYWSSTAKIKFCTTSKF